MCFRITNNKPLPIRVAYKIVTRRRAAIIKHWIQRKLYRDGTVHEAHTDRRIPGSRFVTGIGSKSSAGIYVYTDKAEALKNLRLYNPGRVVIKVRVAPSQFLASGRDQFTYGKPEVATYRRITVVGVVS